jgi:sulfoacetaldehyde acetyltransferase
VRVNTTEELTAAIAESCKAQDKGVATLVEVVVNKELGAPFRRDAMRDQATLLPRYAELTVKR